MSTTHDYNTRTVKVRDLTNEHVLLGECGGLSAIFNNEPSSFGSGLQSVTTEHGMLLLDPDAEIEILADDP